MAIMGFQIRQLGKGPSLGWALQTTFTKERCQKHLLGDQNNGPLTSLPVDLLNADAHANIKVKFKVTFPVRRKGGIL